MPVPRRQLMILRHAMSAWPDGVPDRRRPLAKRGRRDASAAGRWLREHIVRVDATALLAVVRELPTSARTALLVGHNPGVQEFVALLSGQEPEMKTSSVALLAWEGSWADADADAALLQHHATPRG